jgi:hypothetical protein
MATTFRDEITSIDVDARFVRQPGGSL